MTLADDEAQILELFTRIANGNYSTNGEPESDLLGILTDWGKFWAQDYADEQWLAWPVIPLARQTVIYSPAKAGKSLLVLDLVASLATGGPILGQPNNTGRRHILYLDYEMTPGDLYERLEDMGYGATTDLTHLHYASLPSLPPLNTPEGATAVRRLAELVGAELVVIDTIARAVIGDENIADTINAFYSHTGLALKADGRALLRLDHAGKDASKGQRGSSAKAGDIDLVWQLTRGDDGITLTRKEARIGWADEKVAIAIEQHPLRHTIASRLWKAGSKGAADQLDALGADLGISSKKAIEMLREAGTPTRRQIVLDALRWRREQAESLWVTPGTTALSTGTSSNGNHPPEPLAETAVDQPGTGWEPAGTSDLGQRGNRCVSSRDTPGTTDPTDEASKPDEEEW